MKLRLCLIFSLLLAPLAYAQGDEARADESTAHQAAPAKPETRIYRYTNKDGVVSFSDRAPRGTPYRVVSYSCYACNLKSKVDWHNTPLQLTLYESSIQFAAKKHGVDPALVRAVIHAESAFKADAISRKGAMGLMQLMPGTAGDMGVRDVMSPAQNIQGGVRYLAWLLQQHSGNVILATAAYNAGPGAVKRHKGIPPYAETETYVRRVKILHERYRKAMAASAEEMVASAL